MKKLIYILAVILFCACANGSNENKGDEAPINTPTPSATSDSPHADTMMQPNGVTNGTIGTDTTH